MSDEPARIWATEDRKNYGEDRFHATSPMTGLTEYVRADLSDALLREAMEALENRDGGRHDDDCKAFRPINGMCNCGHDEARTTLAKLRAHLGEKE